jgi:uncharacterized membrane protein YfcA
MVGLGGGFLIVPILLLFFGLAPAQASGTALALVVANSGAGATTYLLQKRVHVRVGLLIAAGGFPGSILGALASAHISATLFDALFSTFLFVVAADMTINREKRLGRRSEKPHEILGMPVTRALTVGLGVGFISSLFGIGGGALLVPSLLYLSDLPAHMISATSHFGIVLTSPVGLAAHWAQHDITWSYVIPLVLGGLIGGPIGAKLSMRLPQKRLVTFVAAALAIAAAALAARDFTKF